MNDFIRSKLFLTVILGLFLTNITSGQNIGSDDKSVTVKQKNVPTTDLGRIGVAPDKMMPLTLNEAIALALENNDEIELARDEVKINEARLTAAEGVYEPIFSIDAVSKLRSLRGVQSWNEFSVDLNAQKFLRRGGASINPFLTNTRTGNFFGNSPSGIRNDGRFAPNIFNNVSLGAAFTQPLLRNRSIDNNRRQIRIQKKRLEQSDADFRRQTIEIISRVQKAYWNLVFALRDQQNRLANLNLSKEVLRRVEAQIEDGAEAPLARAEVETEISNREIEVFEAEQKISEAENILKQLILSDTAATEWSRQLIPTDKPNVDFIQTSLSEALTIAGENRPELQKLKLQREINNIEIEYFRNQTKPRVDLITAISIDGFSQSNPALGSANNFPLIAADAADVNADSFLLRQINILRNDSRLNLGNVANVPNVAPLSGKSVSTGGNFQAFRNLLSPRSPNFTVGVSMSFPFKNKVARAELARAEIESRRNDTQTKFQEQAIYTEIRNALQGVETARKKLLSARKAKENAAIQLQGEQDLYSSGRSTTFLLFQRENTLVNAQSAEIKAETDYSKAAANLQLAMATTLQVNNILIK